MSENRIKEVERIKAQYEGKRIDKIDELKLLDKQVKRPAAIFSYVFGSIGALVLGGGMCLAMPEVIEGYMPLGICIGIVGILMVSINYTIYKRILDSRKRKYSGKILTMSTEILNGN